MSAGDMKR